MPRAQPLRAGSRADPSSGAPFPDGSHERGEDERAPWRAFAGETGLLFQIVDDILDATGTTAELGKTPGKDEAAGKATYVSLYGLEQARELADEARRRVHERLDALPADTAVLAELVSAIRERRG